MGISLSLTARNWLDDKSWSDGERIGVDGGVFSDSVHSRTLMAYLGEGNYRLDWGESLSNTEYVYVSGYSSQAWEAYTGRPFTLITDTTQTAVTFTLPNTMAYVIVNVPTRLKTKVRLTVSQ